MSKCYDNPDYDDSESDIQNTWNQHPKVEQKYEVKVMKNIHILPTDKPSRIYLIKSNNRLGISYNPDYFENFGGGTQNQTIYITSDEEIKEGDWFKHIFETIHKAGGNLTDEKDFKKIILTTDVNLIKDGVQAIDDEFLEWFCSKNGQVDFVEVITIEDEKN